MAESIEIQGFCEPGFEPLRDVFKAGFDSGIEKGASLAVTRNGETIVDLWAGYMDSEETRPWEEDTITFLASTSKIIVSICALILIDRGKLDPDKPVVHYWPEFGQQGKGKVLVRQFFNYSSGVPGWEPKIPFTTVLDWQSAIQSLEEQSLWFEPGTRNAYHAETFGFLVGELIRRTSGLTPGKFLQQEVNSLIGTDFYIGTPKSELGRVALPIQGPEMERMFEPGSMGDRVLNTYLPPTYDDVNCLVNEIPGTNGMGNGRSIAQLGAIMANHGEFNGHRFLSKKTLDLALTEQSYRHDDAMDMLVRMGFGFGLNSAEFECPSDSCLHWGGMGGSFCIMDLASRTSLGYAPNQWLPGIHEDPRSDPIRLAYNRIVG